MTIWYRAWLGKIYTVEVENETAKQVVLKGGRREFKQGQDRGYFPTRELAKQFLVDEATKRLESAELSSAFARKELERVKGL